MSKLAIGINLLLWTDAPAFREHEGLLRTLRAWGYDGVEFPVAGIADSDVGRFAALCDELGLGRTAILSLDAQEADPASPDPRLRAAALDQIKSALDKTRRIGAQVLCGPLFQGLGRFTGAAPAADERDRIVDTLRQAGEYARDLGVRLALEPLNRFEMYMVNTMRQAAELVKRIGLPNVGLLADTHHGNIEEERVLDAWAETYDSIVHVHLSENHRGTPGSGHAIPQELISFLYQSDYEGWLTIEAFGPSVPGLISRLHLWRSYAANEEAIALGGLRFVRERLEAASRQQADTAACEDQDWRDGASRPAAAKGRNANDDV